MQQNALFSQLQIRLAHVCAKSEGLGDFSLLNNEATRMSTSWLGSWESSGSLLELSKAAGPLLLLVLGLLSLDSMLLLGPAADNSMIHWTSIARELFP